MSIPIKITSNPATSFFILFKNVVFIIAKEGIILIYNFRDIRYYLKFNVSFGFKQLFVNKLY